MATEAQLNNDISQRAHQYLSQAPKDAAAFLPGMISEFYVN
jgi:hypothetical protein